MRLEALTRTRDAVSGIHNSLTMSPIDDMRPATCERCARDAGYYSGMVGAARCSLIVQSLTYERPEEWQLTRAGLTCSDFEADEGDREAATDSLLARAEI